jgi:hypothetical protein
MLWPLSRKVLQPMTCTPIVFELLHLDTMLFLASRTRRLYPEYYERLWQDMNERRNTLITSMTDKEAEEYEIQRHEEQQRMKALRGPTDEIRNTP